MIFNNEDFTPTEEEYASLIFEIMRYIEFIKNKERDIPLIDIIYDYCFKNGISINAVGDAIADDVYFKSFIEKDCQLHKIMKSDKPAEELGEW